MAFEASQLAGATWVLEQALGASHETSALVIHDEFTAATAACFSKAAKRLRVHNETLLVPTAEQEEYSRKPNPRLEPRVRNAIDNVSRVIVLQEWRHEVTRFRFDVLTYATRGTVKRVASMPGVSLETLHMCSGDLDQLSAICRLYADRLVWGSEITLETGDDRTGRARLVIPVGIYTPRTSTGRVPLRGWCNVPSGETFMIPDPDRSQGAVYINGSIPNFPIPDGEWLRLDVEGGRARATIASSNLPALREAADRYFFDAEGREVAMNCTVLSEIGLGLNPSIRKFTGLPIFDEKIAGTVHLGLGSSNQFGGPTESPMHNDLVIRGASAWIDSCQIIDAGELRLTEADVFPAWDRAGTGRLDSQKKVARTGEPWQELRREGRIFASRQWISDRSEGQTTTKIGDDETAAIANWVPLGTGPPWGPVGRGAPDGRT